MKDEFKRGEVIIYQTPDKQIQLEVKLKLETVWLTQAQIAVLFGSERSVTTKHIENVFKEKELDEKSNVQKMHIANSDKPIKLYNLDVIISVGYRVNSQRATQFRIWATKTLKTHLIKGYTINEKRLLAAQEKFKELQNTISFLQDKSKNQLLIGQEQEIISLISGYSKSLTLLEQYDQNKIKIIKSQEAKFILKYLDALKIILKLRKELVLKKEAGDLFGQEYQSKFEAIINGLYQTFDGQDLYKTVEEKSSHLLYLIIKDHPFADGNKRIASLLFIYFLNKNDFLYRNLGERKINDNALVALSLLIAVSDPKDKEIMIKIITNLLQ